MDPSSTKTHRDIPRSAWPLHPHWPDQVLLLQSHANFRLVSERLEAAVRRAGSLDSSARLFRRWMYAMSNHERYEESKLYPYLDRRWGASMDELTEGHEGLHVQRAEVFSAFDALAALALTSGRDTEAEVRARARVRAAVDGFGRLLGAHLDLEEETVVPLLLELSPKEFADYTLLPLNELLKTLADGAG